MMKKNNLRKLYLAYMLFIGELFCAVFIVCAGYIADAEWQAIVRIVGIAGTVIVPVVMFVYYRLVTREGTASSDEREQMVLMKAFALAGLVALTLLPLLLLFIVLFPAVSLLLVLGYGIVIGAVCKISVFCFYKKY